MVFIHGESYEWNAGNPYDGRVLASFGNVVVVTINYRLGVLGFLPAVDASSRGNYGLMDQVAGLHWIQDNVAEFGGDPENVTIFGQGHGAACVNLLMLSPMARGLFHRAIMQSGSALSPWAIARDAVGYTRNLADTLKCPHHDNTALVECLRKVALEKILAVELQVPEHLIGFGPTIDGIVLPQDPATLMEEQPALFLQYDLMFGTTRVESYMQFSATEEKFGIDGNRRDRLIRTLVRNIYTYHLQEIFLTVVNEYMDWSRPLLHPTDILDGTADALGDAIIVAPIIRTGSFHSGGMGREYSSNPAHSWPEDDIPKKTFFYVFGYQTEGGDYNSRLGCITGEELPYVFGAPLVSNLAHFASNYSRSETVLSEVTMTHWTNFAKFGDPNIVSTQEGDSQSDNVRGRYERVSWPVYEPVHQKYLSIAMKPRVRDHYHAHRLSYWLNLIPRLHRSGDVNVSAQHHRLPDHDNLSTYDGVVRKFNSTGETSSGASTIPAPPPGINIGGKSGISASGNVSRPDEVKTVSGSGSKGVEKVSAEVGETKNQSESNLLSTQGGMFSTALSVTIAVGCSLLLLNILIFAGIYYQKSKNNFEKKMQRSFYQDHRSEDEEGHPSGEKPFLVKDLSSSMMLSQFDSAQTLDLVQQSKPIRHQQYQMLQLSGNNGLDASPSSNQILAGSRTPKDHEDQPLLSSTQQTPTTGTTQVSSHRVTATVDCLPPWPHDNQDNGTNDCWRERDSYTLRNS